MKINVYQLKNGSRGHSLVFFLMCYKMRSLVLFLTWTALAFFSVLTARVFRSFFLSWFKMHVLSCLSILVITIVFCVGVQKTPEQKKLRANMNREVRSLHKDIEIVLISLMSLLIFSGIILRIQRKHFWKLNWLNFFSRIHRIAAYMTIIIAFIGLQAGTYMKLSITENANPNYQYFFCRLIIIFTSWFVLFLWLGAALVYVLFEMLLHKVIFTKIESEPVTYTCENIREYISRGKKLFVFEDKVLDLANFLPLHPGSNLLENYIGTEIGRYIYGGYNSNESKNYHTEFAEVLIEKYKCGNLQPQYKLFEMPSDNSNDENSKLWKISDRISVSKVHSLITFTNKSSNTTQFLYGLDHCGCYITVFFHKSERVR